MTLWFVLFGLVILISFVLALQSMRDYHEIPNSLHSALYLIRNTKALSIQALESLHPFLKGGEILSFERLIKGEKSALVVFGPSDVILKYKEILDLLELEDYAGFNKVDDKDISSWEINLKPVSEKIFQNLPQFNKDEQFWWQLLLRSKDGSYLAQARAVIVSADTTRRKVLTDSLKLKKLPKAFSNSQMLDFYQKRVFRQDPSNSLLNSSEVQSLLTL